MFQDRALEWVRRVLANCGHNVHGGLVEHRIRFWSAVFTVSTDRGTVWLKAANPGQAFEAALLERLDQLVPDYVLAPLAVDASRGWLLLPDDGHTLQSCGDVTADDWEALVVQAARMQVALIPHEAELMGTGLPVLRPDQACEYVVSLVEELVALPPENRQHLDGRRADALLRGLSAVSGSFLDLTASGVPMTLQPNDISSRNTFLTSSGAGRFRLFDFGDAFWSHPFAALQVPTRMATGAWPHPPRTGDPVSARLRHAYLQQWRHVSPGAGLDGLIDAADRLASLHRCESWRRLLAQVDDDGTGSATPELAVWLADAVRPPRLREEAGPSPAR